MIRALINCAAHLKDKVELQQVMEDLVTNIEKEDGCLGCELYQKVKNPNELLLVETWESAANIRSHMTSKNMAVLSGAGKILCREMYVSIEQDELIEELNTIFEKRLIRKG